MQITISSRVEDPSLTPVLDRLASHLGSIARRYFVDRHIHGKTVSELKKAYIARFGITARQFNAIRVQVDGKVRSYRETLKWRIADLKAWIERLEKKIPTLKSRFVRHQKKRRLAILKRRLKKLEDDVRNGTVRMCFGGRKHFNAQYHLEANGLESHEEWREEWRKIRDSEFFCLGSHDENAGNQTCTMNAGLTELRLRVPRGLEEELGIHIRVPVRFTRGREHLEAALKAGQSISYRFKRGKKGRWYVHASTERIDVFRNGFRKTCGCRWMKPWPNRKPMGCPRGGRAPCRA